MLEEIMKTVSAARLPRPEYPRPQFVRPQWLNLNGIWEFEIDHSDTGIERRIWEKPSFDGVINVPFCPESKLSGIGYTDFMKAVWYRRGFMLPWQLPQNRTLLHFGAVDYHAHVWVNGVKVGEHMGGYTPFTLDITDAVTNGINTLVVCAQDDLRTGVQRSGKQSIKYESYACYYTRTTGIWQTVWVEAVPQTYISSVRITPDEPGCLVNLQAQFSRSITSGKLTVKTSYKGEDMGQSVVNVSGRMAQLSVALKEKHLWEPGAGRLYDVELVLEADGSKDEVYSYFGLRSISWDDKVMRINGKPVFQRLVLDQGFYPDGIYTAPSDDALKADVELSMAMGFNGARLHQKVFEPRFLYWADKAGYLVWGEHADWGLCMKDMKNIKYSLPEWLEAVERDYNAPSVVGWCPHNESTYTDDLAEGRRVLTDPEYMRLTYTVTKAVDPTRPVIDASGYIHRQTDIYDSHNYEQDVEKFLAVYELNAQGVPAFNNYPEYQPDCQPGQPYFVSEYGGIRWSDEESDGWGYGQAPTSREEFIERYRGMTLGLLNNPGICAFCYTQLYDVEQEINGLYTYDRKPKFDPAIISEINTAPAAIEQE